MLNNLVNSDVTADIEEKTTYCADPVGHVQIDDVEFSVLFMLLP